MKKSSQILRSQARFLKYIPNFLTICNSLCGFAAMLLMVKAYKESSSTVLQICTVASIMIFSAMIFDVMDGLAARLLNAASLHGIQMDSLSDMVTFGVTPAMMVAIICQGFLRWEATMWEQVYIYLLCSIYLGCAALRLATYNVRATLKTESKSKGSDRFSGLPSPGAAAAICVVLFCLWDKQQGLAGHYRLIAWALPAYAAILGLLMTSTIPYIHAGKWLMSIRRNWRKLPLVAVMLAVVVCFQLPGLAFLTLAYIFSGPILMLSEKLFRKNPAGGAK